MVILYQYSALDVNGYHIPVQRIELKILSKERVSIFINIISWISYFRTRKNQIFINLKPVFLMKNGFSLIDFDVIFPM